MKQTGANGEMKAFVLFAGCLLLLASPSRAVGFSEVQAAGKRVTVCRVDVRKERLRLFLKGTEGAYRRFDALAQAVRATGGSLAFAMNAGMFQPGLMPVGLCIVDGRTVSPLNAAGGFGNFFLKPNGVFLVADGRAQVVESGAFSRVEQTGHVALATQSGPLLVLNGSIHPAFHAESVSRMIRNGVGVTAAGEVVFAISEEPVTFYEFATCFRDVLHCTNALYLDGSVSSLYAPALKRDDFRMELGPLIGVVE